MLVYFGKYLNIMGKMIKVGIISPSGPANKTKYLFPSPVKRIINKGVIIKAVIINIKI